MASNPKQYTRRDIIALDEAGGYYHRHVAAMTEEGLHSKRDIAAELAWRDQRIDQLINGMADMTADLAGKAIDERLPEFRARFDAMGEKLEENEHLKSLLREALELLTTPRGGMGGGLVVPEFMRRVSEAFRDIKNAERRQQRDRLCDELDAELEKLKGGK